MRIHSLLLGGVFAAVTLQAVAGNPPGSLDPAFGDGGKRTVPLDLLPVFKGSNGTSAVAGPGGSIYLVGSADLPSGSGVALSRLTASGDVDNTFGNGGTVVHLPSNVSSATPYGAVLDSDQRLIAAGQGIVDGIPSAMVCRFDSMGEIDPSFGLADTGCFVDALPGFTSAASAVLVHPCVAEDACVDGVRIVIVGSASELDAGGPKQGYIAALKSDGTALDETFGGSGRLLFSDGFPVDLTALAQNSTGAMVAVGAANASFMDASDSDFTFILLSQHGVVEEAFMQGFNLGQPGHRRDVATSVALLEDGSMVVGGYAQTSADRFRPSVVKLLPNTAFDETFDAAGLADPGPHAGMLTYKLCQECTSSALAYDLAVMPDGRIILVGGRANTSELDNPAGLAGPVSNFFAMRLLPNGAPDSSFRSSDSDVSGLALADFGGVNGNSQDEAFNVLLDGDSIVLAGYARAPDPLPNDDEPDFYDFAVARLANGDVIFADGFEAPP